MHTINYESGVHTSLEAAVRRNIMGGLGLMQEQISQQNHDTFGANGWEISAHAASAPDHEDIQGKQYTDKEYEELNNSLARRIGTLHCGHAAFPIIIGVNEPQYTPEQLEKFKEDNKKGVTYNGRHYTVYEATQKQRQIERAIRRQKRCVLSAEKRGDKDGLLTSQIKLRRLNEEYGRYSNAVGLPTQQERLQVAGFGKKQAAQATSAAKKAAKSVDISGENSIIKLNRDKKHTHNKPQYISDERFEKLTIEARKLGAKIIRDEPWFNVRLEEQGASAVTYGDVLVFGKKVTVSDVLEETYHFKQNLQGLNADKPDKLRIILNEIDAKQHLINNAKKYKIPRAETEQTKLQLQGYQKQLEELMKGSE
ncbi:MAG: hypothetical protein IJO03_07290 [Clostridia bacterium]|nr:hypothetical protein [Clostridia bacterium]